ncbi:MAG: tRNA (adenosine(37)-N6)-dimethylallyltransferase MiaA [Candidatus Eisenbacteria bacterium]|uniref:tRNA dimethylallyltransferase n=1 Tax=Eiseniibacteriota bacterium TaxID=2212470 RepID=A0A538TWQ4_UNCEI|nr:MAG: tRNA (adenosine(37)-N6)-dimethylallyltransferase MiaA [Candidatus Eisenbacteria bacterium]
MTRSRVLALVGATATGKTALGESVAERLGGEIVCVDSRQVFRELEIGTGKPSAEERTRHPHHLFDALSLGQRASAGWFAGVCREVRAEIHARGRLPILVGGSGLYLAAARRGLAAEPPHDPALRARLRSELVAAGPEALHARLTRVDPTTAARLAPRDRQRIGRALEVFEASGRPLSWWHAQPTPPPPADEDWITIEIVMPGASLVEHIARRTRWMFDHGLVEETRGLLASRFAEPLRALSAVGYEEAIALCDGRLTRDAAEERVCVRTRQLAKRQRTWFRHQLEAIRLDGTRGADALVEGVLTAIAQPQPPVDTSGSSL